MNNFIVIKNAATNNLKHISVKVPKYKIIAVTGISGSGKSSFVFDTIASESQRLLNETYSTYIQNLLPKYKNPIVDLISNLPVSLVINQKRLQGNSRSTVGTVTDIYSDLRLLYSRIVKPFIGYSMKYSFNNPQGMCKNCQGLGVLKSIDVKKLIDFNKSLNDSAIEFPTFQNGGWRLTGYTESGFFDNDKIIRDYTKNELDLLLYSPEIKPENPTKNWHKTAKYLGVIPRITNAFVNVENAKYKNDLYHFLDSIDDESVSIVINELKTKLRGLSLVGLDYLKLNQPTSTLSGGEAQRIKMVKYLNSALSDVLYIFDEPSVGLYPQDIKDITNIFKEIKNKGNTVLFIDHDLDMIRVCDEVINFGEGAGTHGGKVTFQG
ncbi:excinuclease ABC subunit A [Campylobacter sputorum subsp. bubulus]|uniref:UvrABC system protein A n=1 Tax=Campylobacter sputorum subsp. sputorum TaxID=32024 RepID=A0A381DHH6_9BACT|nr:hypothetical protein [Campylobacter sputorum]SUX08781.1 excinuclease ABC subunit A [Campylobacter sputorum subsp. bubulus]SUX10098.1 excinuclease ABC subunit A [Campylobacter sputorum subsp. sputorum]